MVCKKVSNYNQKFLKPLPIADCSKISFKKKNSKKFCCNEKPFIFVAVKKSNKIIMNKAELIAKMADDAGVTKTQANASLDSFVEAVTKTLKGGGKVTLVGFGTFSVSKRAARNGRNPQTGAVIKIKAKRVAKFKAGKELSAKI
jgi:DNA-binding protein HU-beta